MLARTTSMLAVTFLATMVLACVDNPGTPFAGPAAIDDAACIAVGRGGPRESGAHMGQAWEPAEGILKVDPPTGPLLGSRRVRIDLNASQVPQYWVANQNDLAAIQVTFGGNPCAVQELIDRMIWCKTPPHIAGLVDVTVSIPNANKSFFGSGAFEYVETPAELETPDRLSFDTVTVGYSRSLSVQLANTGDRAASSVKAHTSSGDFSVEHVCDQLESGATCDLGIAYQPTGNSRQTGAVELDYVADGEPRCRTLQLSGTGELASLKP